MKANDVPKLLERASLSSSAYCGGSANRRQGIGSGLMVSLILAARNWKLPAVTCSLDEDNLGGQLFLNVGGFKALPVTDEARREKVIQFARAAKGQGGRLKGQENIMTPKRKAELEERWPECERQIQAIHAGKVVGGDPAELEAKLLEEQDAVEYELGLECFRRRNER